MIQRVQTLYLIIAALLSLLLPFFIPFWEDVNGIGISAPQMFESSSILVKVIPLFLLLSGFLSILSIFFFSKRKSQFILNRVNILLNLIILVLLIYHLQNVSGEMKISEKGIGAIIPLLVIVLLAIANRAIKKDEDLVKSVDRLR